jgi:hypothetical protein
MKKLQVIGIVAALMILGIAGCAQASEIGKDWKIGLGFESMYAGPLLNGLSARVWTGPLGMEADLLQGSAKVTVNNIDDAGDSTEVKGNMWAGELKAMYAIVDKKNSKFYAGANVNYAKFKVNDYGDGSLWTYGPFIGAEFNFDAIPEVGFNFEVGYMLNNGKVNIDNDLNSDAKLDMYGINVGIGAHYYF